MFHFNYGEPHLSMKKHRQATPQQPPTNYSEMLHQSIDSNSQSTSQCSTQFFASNELDAGESSPPAPQSSLLRSHKIRPHKKQCKGEGRVSVMKGICREKKQRN